jgi:hypothetical protein
MALKIKNGDGERLAADVARLIRYLDKVWSGLPK